MALIHVDHEAEWLHGVKALDAEGVHHFILLNDPLNLPTP